MEALGLYNFVGRDQDELSFKKGQVVKILSLEFGPNWHRGELNGKKGVLPKNYVKLYENKWFAGSIPRIEAEKTLLTQPFDGAFLVRNSESSPEDFSLSVKFRNTVQHFRIYDHAGGYYLLKFFSVNELIDYHRKSSVSLGQDLYLKDALPAPAETTATALYNFTKEVEDELTIEKGQKIIVLDDTDQNWWKGRIGDQEGVFPASYVKVEY